MGAQPPLWRVHYVLLDAVRNLEDVSYEDAPSCERHESSVPMKLRTLHSDSTRPDTLVGLYECPECGHEARRPIQTDNAA